MNRFALLGALLELAACAAQPAQIEPHPISAECRGSFSPDCMRPYVEAAQADAARIVNHPGSAGAGIHPPSATYGPIPPAGFRGAARVMVIND